MLRDLDADLECWQVLNGLSLKDFFQKPARPKVGCAAAQMAREWSPESRPHNESTSVLTAGFTGNCHCRLLLRNFTCKTSMLQPGSLL